MKNYVITVNGVAYSQSKRQQPVQLLRQLRHLWQLPLRQQLPPRRQLPLRQQVQQAASKSLLRFRARSSRS